MHENWALFATYVHRYYYYVENEENLSERRGEVPNMNSGCDAMALIKNDFLLDLAEGGFPPSPITITQHLHDCTYVHTYVMCEEEAVPVVSDSPWALERLGSLFCGRQKEKSATDSHLGRQEELSHRLDPHA